MGLSETILAAMIGAIATVSGALFQLFSAFRAKSKIDPRPRKGSTFRSIVAVLALMVASAAGGFLYSELMKQRSAEEMRAMRDELKEVRALIAADHSAKDEPPPVMSAQLTSVVAQSATGAVESMTYVPACRSSTMAAPCGELEAQRIALCGTIPSYARVEGIELFAQRDSVQKPWDQYRAQMEQDLGAARFTGKSFEYAQEGDLKAVCVNFVHWNSEHPHIARVLVRYAVGEPAQPVMEPVPLQELGEPDSAPLDTATVIASGETPTIFP